MVRSYLGTKGAVIFAKHDDWRAIDFTLDKVHCCFSYRYSISHSLTFTTKIRLDPFTDSERPSEAKLGYFAKIVQSNTVVGSNEGRLGFSQRSKLQPLLFRRPHPYSILER